MTHARQGLGKHVPEFTPESRNSEVRIDVQY
jgi:hypothetical protein